MRFFKANFHRYCVKKSRNVPENKFFGRIEFDSPQLNLTILHFGLKIHVL